MCSTGQENAKRNESKIENLNSLEIVHVIIGQSHTVPGRYWEVLALLVVHLPNPKPVVIKVPLFPWALCDVSITCPNVGRRFITYMYK